MSIGSCHSGRLRAWARWAVVGGLFAVLPDVAGLGRMVAAAQVGVTGPAGSTGTVLRGRTLDAVTGLPLARVLVQTDSAALLSDHEGGFVLPTEGIGPIRLHVRKPGYSVGPEQMDGDTILLQAGTTSADVRMFPEAIVAGTVSDPEGQPVVRVSVHVYRSVFDERGHIWMDAGQSQTDTRGEFRLPVPAGAYVVSTEYLPRIGGRPEAVLPVVFPAQSSGKGAAYLRLGSGQEQRVDLQPPMRHTFVQRFTVVGTPVGYFPQITATLPNGTGFGLRMRPTQEAGVFSVDLPAGTYVVRSGLRTRDSAMTAEARVTVPSNDPSPMASFTSSPQIPIEVVLDPAGHGDALGTSGGVSAPTAQQLNLTLWRSDNGLPAGGLRGGAWDSEIRVASESGGGAMFVPPPGVYRLFSGGSGGWYVESATMGGSDLLSHELTIGVAAGTSPIRVVVSRASGMVRGQIRSADPVANLPVFLVATQPSLHPLTVLTSSVEGVFSASLPPGSYRAIAFEHRHSVDLADRAVLDSFKGRVSSFTVQAGETSTLELTPVLDAEVQR